MAALYALASFRSWRVEKQPRHESVVPGLCWLGQLLGKGKTVCGKERSLYEPRISQIQTLRTHWVQKQDLALPGPL